MVSTTEDRRRSDTRDRLVDAAVDIYRRRGPGGTGLAEVCGQAGTTKGVLSHHFPGGKEELVLATIERNAGEVTATLERLLDGSPSTGDALRTFFSMYASLLRDDSDFGCPLAAAVVDASSESADVRDALATAFDAWIAMIARTLRERGWSAAEARELAVTAVAAMEGAIIVSRATGRPAMLESTGRWLSRIIDRHDAVIASSG